MNEKLVQTYVKHEDQWFFVSTINRESSASESPGFEYAETIAWKIAHDNTRQEMLDIRTDMRNHIQTHLNYIHSLFEFGEAPPERD